ncbi:MAG TPA: pyrroline-5-carboxylate reductase [Thermodesulfobacteriota bacterium]|nr:pyrroline-5-carboxylate reductase [Thermodesulfobacteriota bacterium]
MQMKIGFIGAGNMAEALVKGLLSSDVFKNDQIIMSDVVTERLNFISSQYHVRTTSNNNEVAKSSDLVVLAVKPNLIGVVLDEIKTLLTSRKILISIAAGITTSFISRFIKKKTKIARVMPNTPALVLAGASVVYCNSLITREEREKIKHIFQSIGVVHIIENEELLDAVTGLSGSGPAYVAMFIEALSDGGVKMGLSRDMALNLAAQTVYGTAKMVLESGIHPAELKDKVSSPGGTTIEGIKELEVHGLRGSVISAVESATRRSKELSKGGK